MDDKSKPSAKLVPDNNSMVAAADKSFEPTMGFTLYQKRQPVERPYGIYNASMPTVDLGTNRKFDKNAYQHLFAPNVVANNPDLVRMPMQNVYNIVTPSPTGNGHVEMNAIYEDIMPGRDGKMTSTTLGERLTTLDYIRQKLVKMYDGEDIGLSNDKSGSLYHHIKLLELNPYYYSQLYTNPYRGLPYGLLIYNACFPIKFSERSQSAICGPESVGLNVRLYALSYAEYYSYALRQPIKSEYDVWRELAFYEYIRENIIKPKKSPNFAILYTWFTCCNGQIDYFALKRNSMTQTNAMTREYQKILQLQRLYSNVLNESDVFRPLDNLGKIITSVANKLPDEVDPSLQLYSGTTLILVTEAPHHNIYQWDSKIYEIDGAIRRMTSQGWHDKNVWLGIIFQIVHALYVMQVSGIYIKDMTLQDNIYIKDLQTYGTAKGYWKYVVGGITYYVPNYGYVVMVDSNYKDIIPSSINCDPCKRLYKIYTNGIVGKTYNMDSLKKLTYKNYKNLINTNSFTKEFTKNDVNRPPVSIMNIISKMMLDNEEDLSKIMVKWFSSLLNNRIGTLLRVDTEVKNIREIDQSFSIGDMAVEVLNDNLYKWCMITQVSGPQVTFITKESSVDIDYVFRTVNYASLKQYSNSEIIEQLTSPDIIFSTENLLETYIIE